MRSVVYMGDHWWGKDPQFCDFLKQVPNNNKIILLATEIFSE